MRVQLEPAWLLSVRPYRESSALIEAFTRSHGRVGIVARGVRGSRSRLRGVLQPFQRLLLSWSERGELGTLSGAEPDGPPAPLRGEAVFAGWYVNELVLRLTQRRDAHPEAFGHYTEVLAALAAGTGAAALRVFEKRLLAALGYGLQLPDDLDPGRWYAYDADAGLRLAEEHPTTYPGASLAALAREQLADENALRDARRLLKAALKPHLGDRALRTPAMLRALRAARRAP